MIQVLKFSIFTLLILVVFSSAMTVSVQPVKAQSYQCECNNPTGSNSKPRTYPTQQECSSALGCSASGVCPAGQSAIVPCAAISSPGSSPKLINPLPTTNIPELLGNALGKALGIVGSIALALFIYGGFTWMTAGGNTARVTTGRNVLVWASIGLIVIFLSYALLTFVFDVIR